MAKPKLALIPAAQGTKLYSVLPSDGTGDFTFTRGSVGTRINAQGLIENVASGQSRLDYPLIDGVQKGCPHHILEPARTQLIQYSQDFSNAAWIKGGVTVNANQAISPDGTLNADLMQVTVNLGNIYDNVSGSGDGSFSVFAKYIDIKYIRLRSTNSYAYFDIENGTIGNTLNVLDTKIENYGNGWYRCTVIGNNTNSLVQVFASNTDSGQPTGLGSVYLWGAQFEQGSYATSYIPTNGESGGVTRSAETATGAGNSTTFNDSEGVLMAEISALANDSINRQITLSDGTDTNRLVLKYDNQSNIIQGFNRVNGSETAFLSASVTDITLFSKCLLKYKLNDYALWINGFELATDTSSTTFPSSTLNDLKFGVVGAGSNFLGKTKQLQYFDTALADTQLEQLTSWQSFRDMADGQLYSVE